MSSSKPTISQEQRIFEIEERVYRLLAPEFRTKYLAYRKVPTYPEDQRINYGRKTAEYFESIANKFASDFILNNNRQLILEEDINLEESPMSYNNNTNINMENLAQLIASAISSAMPKNTENTNSHIRIPVPSTYGGDRNAATINIWIQEVERYLQFYNVPSNQWIPYAVTLMRDRAQKWWNRLTERNEQSTTWERFKLDIEYAFKPSYSQQAARDRLANIKQSSSVIEYVDVFQDILLDLPNISDDESLDRFVRGLKDNVRIHVLTKEPRTLEEASKFAIAFESAQQVGMMPVKIQQDRYVNDPMDLSVLLHQLNAMVASNKDNSNFQQNRQNNGYARRSTIICHWCNKPGHIMADCRTRIRDIKEFEQSRIRQNRQYKRTRPFRNHLVNNIDSMEFHTSNNDTLPKRNNDCSFDSVNKDSLIDLSPYSFDFSQDRAFLLNTNAKNSTLPTYKIYINGHAFNALIDSGVSSNYIHPKVLKFVESYHPVKNQAVETANGEQTIIHGEATCKMEIRGEEKNFISTFKAFVFESKFDIILGNSWLKQVKPKPDWFDSTWTIALPDSSMVVLHPVKEPTSLIKKQNEVNYLISAKQLERLYKTKQIEECYFAQVHLKENEMVYLNNINDIDASWSTEFSKEFPEVFKGEITGLPPMRDTQDIIVTKPDTVPVSRPPYKMSPLELSELQKQLNELLNKGLIEPCASEWSNPVLFVRKPNGDLRMCCDYRMLNKVTLKQKIQLPRIDECLERLHNAKHFTSLDLTNGFHQQRITEADSIKTAISTRYGQFCWKVVPFGLSNSGPAFQKMMNSVLSEYIDKFVMVYLDDILIFTNGNEDQHKEHVRLVLKKLDEAKLIINKKKCKFNRKELTFLGFTINEKGIHPDNKKVEAIQSWPVPKNVQQVRQFIGLAQHYRRFIPGFASIAASLTDLTKGTGHKCRAIIWNDECQKGFDLIKKMISSAPVLMTPDMNKPFRIECDASDFAIGAVLMQEESEGTWKPLAFESKKLSQAERNYPAQERELLSILHALRTWRCFIEGNSYQIFTDHLPLKYLRSQNKPTPRLVRWLSEIELYDPEILYKPGADNQIPDLLSRRDGPDSIPDPKSIQPRYVYHITAALKSLPILEQDPIQDWPLHYLNDQDKWPEKLKDSLNKLKHHFVIKDKQVYRIEKIQKTDNHIELKFIPFSRRADLVNDFHAGYGHSGRTTVYHLMKTRVWWPRMQEDINAWISKCPKCQLAASPDKNNHHAPMKPLEVPPAFSRWHLDFIGELPITKNGNRWLLMAVDYTTNWPIARALKNATGEEIVKFIYEEIVMRFGCPQEIITDRGPNFMSKVVKQYIKKIKTRHNLTSAFHPRTNGKCERLNQTFKKMLTKYVDGAVHSWDEYIQWVEKWFQCFRLAALTLYNFSTTNGNNSQKHAFCSAFAAYISEKQFCLHRYTIGNKLTLSTKANIGTIFPLQL